MIELIQYRWGSSRPDRRRSEQGAKMIHPTTGPKSDPESSLRQRIRESHFLKTNDGTDSGRCSPSSENPNPSVKEKI